MGWKKEGVRGLWRGVEGIGRGERRGMGKEGRKSLGWEGERIEEIIVKRGFYPLGNRERKDFFDGKKSEERKKKKKNNF